MKKIQSFIKNNQLGLGLILLNLTLLLIYAPNHYYFEMLQSFAFQMFLITSILSVIFLFNRSWIIGLISILSIGLLGQNFSLFKKNSTLQANFSIAHFNVLKLNQNYNKTIEAALESQADFLSFNELTPEWNETLYLNLKEQYPYSYSQLSAYNSFGIAVYSKFPINNLETYYWSSQNIPTLTGDIQLANKKIHFVAAHTIPPLNKANFSKRNNHLFAIKEHLKSIEGSKILVGDLNAVSWSQALTSLKEENTLVDSRKSWVPTFPSWMPALAIPIDHIFTSQDLYCTQFESIKSTSSDHYGIMGKFYIPTNLSLR